MIGATRVLCPNVALTDQRALQLTFSADNVAMNYTSPQGVDPTKRIYYIYISGLNSSSALSVRYPFTLFILVRVHAHVHVHCARLWLTISLSNSFANTHTHTHKVSMYLYHFYCYTICTSYCLQYITLSSRVFLFLLSR